MLDESLRRRVGEIARQGEPALSAAARERIFAHVAEEGPRLVRRARFARTATFAAGPLLAVAAAAMVFLRHPAPVTSPTAHKLPLVAPRAAACATRGVPERVGFVASERDQKLDLSSLAFAVADTGTEAQLTELAPCRTVISLGTGRVTVHAKDLGGGELRVVARDGVVTVHGTVFSVEQTNDSLTVEVAEGRVGVKERDGDHEVSAGHRLVVSPVGIAEGDIGAERARALRRTVGVPEVFGLDTLPRVDEATSARPAAGAVPHAGVGAGARLAQREASPEVAEDPAPALSETPEVPTVAAAAPAAPPADLLAQAEVARRAGDFAGARALYRKASDGHGPTAEAACVALARMELSLGHGGAALEATKQRRARFGEGTLAPEALWIDVRAYRQQGDPARAKALAEELARRFPSSPQAHAAEQWLSGG
ncbi:MAG TPA: FecR domain-containing protein [Polyangiaceae bacterium]|nr:FecR domain-containing protein [Polyangiaceae bacterium]